MKDNNKIPLNMNNNEESLFWDNHDFMDYINDTKREEFTISQNLKNAILARCDAKSKKKNYNAYLMNYKSSSNLNYGSQYIYLQTKSSVDHNPDLRGGKKNPFQYEAFTA